MLQNKYIFTANTYNTVSLSNQKSSSQQGTLFDLMRDNVLIIPINTETTDLKVALPQDESNGSI